MTQSHYTLLQKSSVSSLGLNPYPWYKQMRLTEPVSVNEQEGFGEVFRYPDVEAVLADHVLFSSKQLLIDSENTSMAVSDPPAHKKLRGLVSQAFTPYAISQQEERIRGIVNELLDAVMASDTMNVIQDLAGPLPVRVISKMIGIPYERLADIKSWGAMAVGPSLEHALMGKQSLEGFLYTLVAQRRKAPEADLISDLLVTELDGELLDDRLIVDTCLVLLFAGSENTTHLISHMLLCLDEHPESREQVWADPPLLPSTIEEVLRFRPMAQRLIRLVTRDLEIGGKQFKEGYRVVAWIGSANHDEEYFADPDIFDIRRTPNRHLSLGHGVHFCLGASLLRLEAKIALEALIERFKDVQRVREVPLLPYDSVSIYGVRELPIRLQRR